MSIQNLGQLMLSCQTTAYELPWVHTTKPLWGGLALALFQFELSTVWLKSVNQWCHTIDNLHVPGL